MVSDFEFSVKKGGKVWVLDRSVFLTVMMRTAQERVEGNVRFLRQVSVLQKLPEPKDHLLAKISDLIRVASISLPNKARPTNFFLQIKREQIRENVCLF